MVILIISLNSSTAIAVDSVDLAPNKEVINVRAELSGLSTYEYIVKCLSNMFLNILPLVLPFCNLQNYSSPSPS